MQLQRLAVVPEVHTMLMQKTVVPEVVVVRVVNQNPQAEVLETVIRHLKVHLKAIMAALLRLMVGRVLVVAVVAQVLLAVQVPLL